MRQKPKPNVKMRQRANIEVIQNAPNRKKTAKGRFAQPATGGSWSPHTICKQRNNWTNSSNVVWSMFEWSSYIENIRRSRAAGPPRVLCWLTSHQANRRWLLSLGACVCVIVCDCVVCVCVVCVWSCVCWNLEDRVCRKAYDNAQVTWVCSCTVYVNFTTPSTLGYLPRNKCMT